MGKFIAGLLVLGVVGYIFFSEEDEPATVSNDAIAGLLACISADVCSGKHVAAVVHGEYIDGVTVDGDGVEVFYFFTSQNRFGIRLVQSKSKQILIEDLDWDGKVDRYSELTSDGVNALVFEHMSRETQRIPQRIYIEMMTFAEKRVIPSSLLEEIRRQKLPSGPRKET